MVIFFELRRTGWRSPLILSMLMTGVWCGCKPLPVNSSQTLGSTGDFASTCRTDPSRCTVEAVIREQMGAIPCSQVWTKGGDDVFAFDKYSSQYHRTQQKVSTTHEVTMTTLGGVMSGRLIDPMAARTLDAQVQDLLGQAKNSVDWASMPVGWERMNPINGALPAVFPKFYAWRVTNELLGGREEWTIFRTSVPPNLKRGAGNVFGQSTGADLLRDEVASFCVPVRTHVESLSNGQGPSVPLLSVIQVLNEADDLMQELQNWDILYNAVLTLADNFPITKQVRVINRGCVLKEESCWRALLISAADVGSYFLWVPTQSTMALGRTTYVVVAGLGTAAQVIDAHILAGEASQAVQQGQNQTGIVLSGRSLIRFGQIGKRLVMAMMP